jgi:hypothetical protein
MAKRALTPAERQARWRERHVEGDDGERERLQFVFLAGTKERLAKIAAHYGYKSITALIEQWAVQTVSEIDAEKSAKPKRK